MTMKEGANSVKRLLWAIYSISDDDQIIKVLAHYLNYHEKQLREDISEIPNVSIEKSE